VVGGDRIGVVIRCAGHIEQGSAKRELLGAVAIGEQAVVTDAMEATRQYVEEEAAYEFGDLDTHDFVLANTVFPIVLSEEADVGLVEVEQATVRDRDAVGVAGEVGQDLLGTGEGLFRIDDPFGCTQGRENGCKRPRVVEADKVGKELQFTGFECCRQTLEKQVLEHAREHANGKKGSWPAGDPTLAVRRNAATRNDAVNVRVVMKVLTPCVQNSGDADVGTKMPVIGGNDGQGLGRGLEQQSIDFGLILVGDCADRGRNGENQVTIRNRQKLGFARRKPCRRGRPLALRAAAIATRIERDACVRAILAAVDMTTKRGGATNFDRRHHASLGEV
jgi:hypothetical protein